jgi:hypothetical protein
VVVKLPGIPKRPGPVVLDRIYGHSGSAKTWIMLEHARIMQERGFKVLFMSFDPKH